MATNRTTNNAAKTSAAKAVTKTEATTDTSNEVLSKILAEFESLKNDLSALKEENTVLKEELKAKVGVVATSVEETLPDNMYTEPRADKQVRIMSLCYGTLNLSTEPGGRGRVITFDKFGEVKTILYSVLIDIVNQNRRFAETGRFYIMDKDAVYYLGLEDSYKNIMTKEVMDNIDKYSAVDIEAFVSNAPHEQVEAMVRNIIQKMYNGNSIDLNKVDAISRASGINITEKVNEMKGINLK